MGRWRITLIARRRLDVGLYSTGVNEQYAYEKPMERANHEDVRWAAPLAAECRACSPGPRRSAAIVALPHTDEQMTPVEYKIDLPASEATVLCLSVKTLGVGSNGCGPRPLEKYIVRSRPAQFAYVLRLLPAGQKPTPEVGRPPPAARQRPAAGTATRRTDRSRWRVVSCTSFQEGEGEPEHLFDGDPSTFWHSRWKTNPKRNPHELVIDFGAPRKIGVVVYRAREDMENGRVKDYEIFFSTDGKTWGRPAAAGRFENSSDEEQEAKLVRPVAARFMKFVAKRK